MYNDNTLNDYENILFNSDLDRFRRNAKTTKANEKENNLAQTMLHKQDNVKLNQTNKKKFGCVSIVKQQTAIVNLHKANFKESKIKKLLSKLHFHKRNKKNKKEKRHCTRVQRFNPIKKLRDIFMQKQDKVMSPNMDAAGDYDMITSHIDTFKPVKYNKIPNIDELRNQVPNITGDITTNLPDKMVGTNPDSEFFKDDTKKIKTNTLTDNIDTNVSVNSYPVILPSKC